MVSVHWYLPYHFYFVQSKQKEYIRKSLSLREVWTVVHVLMRDEKEGRKKQARS